MTNFSFSLAVNREFKNSFLASYPPLTEMPRKWYILFHHTMAKKSWIPAKIREQPLLNPVKVKRLLTGFIHTIPQFVTELLLLVILIFSVGANLRDQANSSQTLNRSLLFSFLKNNAELNPKLLDAYESVNLKLAAAPSFPKNILAASKKSEASDSAPAVLPTLSGQAILKPNPAGNGSAVLKRDVEIYQVKNGDTVAAIAATYGVSVDTVLWENNLTAAGLIRPGQELHILPTTGLKHVVKEGETISGIAKKYGLSDAAAVEEVFAINGIEEEDGHIFPGDELIIPNGVKKTPLTRERQQYLAEVQREDYRQVDVPSDYQGGSANLVWPLPAASRLSQRFSGRHRAIDVPCRDCNVVSAGAGIVELSGWQKGYGNTVVVNHGNGIKTRYGHGKQLLVTAGDEVQSGQAIMISGSTGRSTGPHLHFEIKINGQLVNPLDFVKP